MKVENNGNLITQRAFVERDGVKLRRIDVLALLTKKKGSTAYQMTEPIGIYDSGTPSPLHVLCEIIRKLEEIEREEDSEFSSALEMAQYPLVFLKQLRSEMPDTDDIHKLGLLIKNSTDANYLLAGRFLKDLPLGELKEFGQLIMTVATIANELGMMIDGHIQAKGRGYQGAPIQKENKAAMA